MGDVIPFPDTDIESWQRIREVKEELLELGLYKRPQDIPNALVFYILEYWGVIYEEGYEQGLRDAAQKD